MGTPHTSAKDSVLCTPVSFVACDSEMVKKSFSGVRWCIPQMRGPRTPAKDSVLCTPVSFVPMEKCPLYYCSAYAFLKVQVTLPKESLSPSLIGVALSGSRRLPLMRVEFVLFRSVTV